MQFTDNPFFWALISMFGLVVACAFVGNKKMGKYPLVGITIVVLFDLGRVLFVLPFCTQPRLDLAGQHWLIGGSIFVAGLIFCSPGVYIKPFTAPDEDVKLNTTGFYAIVRNPIYLGEVLWCLGWAIMFRSIIGVALVPFWWAGLLCLVLIEEKSLERELRNEYREYKRKVKGRIIPGLPI